MKKTVLILTLFVSIIITHNSFAQTAGDKAPAKTPAATTNDQNKKGWTSEDRHVFIDECFKNAEPGVGVDTARFYCYCMQEKIEIRFPNSADANKLSADDLEKPEWQKIAKDCIQTIGKWTSADRSEFLSECVNVGQETLGKEKATSYCACMLFKMEKKFPDPNDAGLSEEMLATPEWKKIIKDCMDF